MTTAVRCGVVAGALVAVAGALAWVTGFSFIFPSLGPTAYLLAVRSSAPPCRPRTVVGGHAIGVAGGLVAFSLLAPDVAVTAGGMLVTGLRHAPACATTLIVSLGLLSTPPQAAGIFLAVVVLVGVHVASRALGRSLSTISSSAGWVSRRQRSLHRTGRRVRARERTG